MRFTLVRLPGPTDAPTERARIPATRARPTRRLGERRDGSVRRARRRTDAVGAVRGRRLLRIGRRADRRRPAGHDRRRSARSCGCGGLRVPRDEERRPARRGGARRRRAPACDRGGACRRCDPAHARRDGPCAASRFRRDADDDGERPGTARAVPGRRRGARQLPHRAGDAVRRACGGGYHARAHHDAASASRVVACSSRSPSRRVRCSSATWPSSFGGSAAGCAPSRRG